MRARRDGRGIGGSAVDVVLTVANQRVGGGGAYSVRAAVGRFQVVALVGLVLTQSDHLKCPQKARRRTLGSEVSRLWSDIHFPND